MSATHRHIHLHIPTLAEVRQRRKPIPNVNEAQADSLSALDRVALFITDRVGTMGFFLIIFGWTVTWTLYNILASEVPSLHLRAFDPFPAFVAYLLISNVIQILLMPLIMVGQNLQGHHSELRAENDYQVNVRAEHEVEVILHHLEVQSAILLAMAEKMGIDCEAVAGTLRERGIVPPGEAAPAPAAAAIPS